MSKEYKPPDVDPKKLYVLTFTGKEVTAIMIALVKVVNDADPRDYDYTIGAITALSKIQKKVNPDG